MAQSRKELKELNISDSQRKKSSSNEIALTKELLVQNSETKECYITGKIISRVRKRIYKLELNDRKVTHRNRRWIRSQNDDTRESVQKFDKVPKLKS